MSSLREPEYTPHHYKLSTVQVGVIKYYLGLQMDIINNIQVEVMVCMSMKCVTFYQEELLYVIVAMKLH